MEHTSRPTMHPAGAGTLLITIMAACIGVGALIGWAVDAIGYGILIGVIVGVPAGVLGVYLRYRSAF
jgi:F0F1-type ATP synthase assembly protein I